MLRFVISKGATLAGYPQKLLRQDGPFCSGFCHQSLTGLSTLNQHPEGFGPRFGLGK